MRIVLSGATGLIGQALVEALSARGDEAVVLTRDPAAASARRLAAMRGVRAVAWNAHEQRAPWWEEVARADAIVNLAGESLAARRWSQEQKQRILRSRVDATRALVKAIEAAPTRPAVFVSASAVGYYGFRGDEELTEDARRGNDFLASVCYEWESATAPLEAMKVRLVLCRIGVVFAAAGSALQQMALPFRLFAGGPMGSGDQWLSWVHLDDVVGLFLAALDSPRLRGPVNVTAPTPVRNRELSQLLGKTLHRPSWMPVPGFALRAAVGEMSEILVTGQRVVPKAALAAGYSFRHADCGEALRSLLP